MGMTTKTSTEEFIETHAGTLRVQINKTHALVFVPSSEPGKHYAVIITRHFATCDCKGFHYRGKCRHVTLVRSVIGA